MTTAATRLSRCTMRSCAWRFADGPDRPCPQHEDEGDALTRAAEELGIDLTVPAKAIWHAEDGGE